MAKLQLGPYPGFAREPSEDFDTWVARTKGLMDLLEAASNNLSSGRVLQGALVRFVVADGYAIYIVTKDDPLTIQHVPFLDGYQADAATLRGVNKDTIRRQLARIKIFEDAFKAPDEFYSKLKLDQVVHYHDAFGRFVRCKVVAHAGEHSRAGKALLPVALVGDWKPYDLPRRQRNGDIHYGYHADSIIKKQLFTPNDSFIYESPRYPHRGHFGDPSKLEPINLNPPPATEEELRLAVLWRQVDQIRMVTEDHRETNPENILCAVRSIVNRP